MPDGEQTLKKENIDFEKEKEKRIALRKRIQLERNKCNFLIKSH